MVTMSKLKRKKSATEESRSEQQSRSKKSKDNQSAVQDSSSSKTSTDREKWWESSELSDVERLWALTLRAFCPDLQSDQDECIPQLPPPSSTTTCVQNVSDWRCSADEDVNSPPDLPVPSFLTNPPPVNDFSAPSQPPTAESTGKSVPPAISDQENHAFSSDQENVSVCDVQTAQQPRLEDKVSCIEGRELSDKQSDTFDQVGKVSEMQEVTGGFGAGSDVESGPGKGAKTGAGGSGSWLRTISEVEGSVSGMGIKQGAGGSGSGQRAKSGVGQRAKSGVRGSGLVLGAKSGVGLDAESGAGKGVKTGAGGSGSRLKTISEAVSGLGTKQGACGSGSGQKAKSGTGGFESGLGTNLRASGSGLGQGTKSGSEGSGSDFGTKSAAEGSGAASGSGLGTKSVAEGSRAASGSGLECCPMCLMPFPAGFTQMECDGHLAQCLSDMHEDIVW